MYDLGPTVSRMILSLKIEAEKHEISEDEIREVFEEKGVNGLDDVFEDGGEVRCEHFVDLADGYALQFGKMESRSYDKARWEAIELAMDTF